jgi:hypothetical protein
MSYDDICRLSDELRLVLSLVFKQFAIRNELRRWRLGNLSVRVEFDSAAAAAGLWDVTPCSQWRFHEILRLLNK